MLDDPTLRLDVLPARGSSPHLGVRARRLAAPRGVCLLSHGLSEHGGRLSNLEDMLVASGFSVFGVDLRGHGRSGSVATPAGARLRVHVEHFDDFLDDFDRWFAWVDEQLADEPLAEEPGADARRSLPRFLLGHSMGGLIAACYATRRRPELAGLVCLSAAFGMHPKQRIGAALASLATAPWGGRVALLADPLTRALSIGDIREGLSSDTEVWQAFCADPLVHLPFTVRLTREIGRAGRELLAGPQRPSVPQLVLHGSRDLLTDPEGSRRWAASCDASLTQLEIFEGLRHELHNEPQRERVFEVLRTWLDAQLERVDARSR